MRLVYIAVLLLCIFPLSAVAVFWEPITAQTTLATLCTTHYGMDCAGGSRPFLIIQALNYSRTFPILSDLRRILLPSPPELTEMTQPFPSLDYLQVPCESVAFMLRQTGDTDAASQYREFQRRCKEPSASPTAVLIVIKADGTTQNRTGDVYRFDGTSAIEVRQMVPVTKLRIPVDQLEQSLSSL